MMVNEINALIDPAVAALGYELVGCELLQQGKDRLLRVYVDGQAGINVDECAKISRQLGAVLDVEDPLKGAYRLEVSSPGIERPLFTLAHYKKFIGHSVFVELYQAKNEQRRFRGLLTTVDDQVHLQLENEEELVLSLEDIKKAHLIAEL